MPDNRLIDGDLVGAPFFVGVGGSAVTLEPSPNGEGGPLAVEEDNSNNSCIIVRRAVILVSAFLSSLVFCLLRSQNPLRLRGGRALSVSLG